MELAYVSCVYKTSHVNPTLGPAVGLKNKTHFKAGSKLFILFSWSIVIMVGKNINWKRFVLKQMKVFFKKYALIWIKGKIISV